MPDLSADQELEIAIEARRRYEVLRCALQRIAAREVCSNCWAVEEARTALEEAGHA